MDEYRQEAEKAIDESDPEAELEKITKEIEADTE